MTNKYNFDFIRSNANKNGKKMLRQKRTKCFEESILILKCLHQMECFRVNENDTLFWAETIKKIQ